MKLFLIDGHALIFKMYYAFLGRPMVNGRGVDTSILFGFTKYLLELIEREKPTHLAVSFDPPGGTFRNKLYPEYKANRAETPQLVIDALEPLTAICKAMRIPVLMIPGYEADDVIGSMARRSAREGADVYMVTPDKDYGQIVGPGIWQIRPGKSGGDDEVLGPAEVCAKWGISDTSQVIDILAICGDTADNVPGVSGVGPVGAAKLLAKYGSLEGIYQHLDELTPRQHQLFDDARPHIGLSKTLVTIKDDIAIDITLEQTRLGSLATAETLDLFKLYEFPSLIRKLNSISQRSADAPAGPAVMQCQSASVNPGADRNLQGATGCNPESAIPAPTKADAAEICRLAAETGLCVLGPATEAGTLTVFVPASHICTAPAETFRSLLEDASVAKAAFSIKPLMHALGRLGISLAGTLKDIELMHYLLNPERSHTLESLAMSYLGLDLDAQNGTSDLFGDAASGGDLFGTAVKPSPDGDLFGQPAADVPDNGIRVQAVGLLLPLLEAELAKSGLTTLYTDVEAPLIAVLCRMEDAGVHIDLGSLREFAADLRTQMAALEAKVREIASAPQLNLSSPKQMGEVIYERLKLVPNAKKPRSGAWPTDEQTLSEIDDPTGLVAALLDYRGLRKLLGTYIEPFPGYIDPADGRVHTTFNQALTATGRLSSSNPNLQNIPVRTEQGKQIRKAFSAPAPGYVIMSADYSQIELRVMAHLCCDAHLIEAFRSGQDIHAATAAKIYHKSIDEVTSDERRKAKTANFGIMYGISSFGLSQRLGCSRSEAKQLIDDYFESFPAIRTFVSDTLSTARERGWVETLSGRRRYVPDIASHNANIRAVAERNAVNAPIQGTAADIMKMAMIRVDAALRSSQLRSRIVLQIHDELLLEVPTAEIEQVKQLLITEMEGAMSLSVPLTVECSYGENWLEAH